MADIIPIKAEMDFVAWLTPNYANIQIAEGGDSVSIPVEDVEAAVLDTLVQTWLNHLYARVNREPPFKKVGL